MDYTTEQQKVFSEILQELREAEERMGRKAVRVRYWTNRYWHHIEIPATSVLYPDMVRRLKEVGITPEVRRGKKLGVAKYIDLKKTNNENND